MSLSHNPVLLNSVIEGLNIISNGFENLLGASDEIIVSGLEHHSNIVPWQMLSLIHI